MTITESDLQQQAKHTTAATMNDMVEPFGFGCEYQEPDGEGGGDCFELWSNEHAGGVTGVYETSEELSQDVLIVVNGGNPLNH